MFSNKIELLAPAATSAIGRAAIDAGADAVYIGGPSFGARAAVGNSIAEIEDLCGYAHLFGAKVYLTLNTLIDDPIGARALVIQAHQAGVDAIIVQDMGVLEWDLPRGIELHASTQCAVRTVERVAELRDAGFSRVVLERGLSLKQIETIIEAVPDVEYELFVHGAICVSYSGECYLSEHLCGADRSANQGRCAQPCRSDFSLLDARGTVLLRDKPLLSPRDLNLSARLPEILRAGVCSLKIEGRLKDERYVVNTVAHYHQELHKLGAERTSQGSVSHKFTPDLDKTFTRGFSEWFFDGKRHHTAQHGAPKGKFLGTITRIEGGCLELDRATELSNGDGIVTEIGVGVRINRVQGRRLFPLTPKGIFVGDRVYGTSFSAFRPETQRKLAVRITINEQGLILNDHSVLPVDWAAYPQAQKAEAARGAFENALKKSGGTVFEVSEVVWVLDFVPFLPASEANRLRRELFALFQPEKRSYQRPMAKAIPQNTPRRGLMGSPYCPLWEYDLCLKNNPTLRPPFYLENNGRKVELVLLCNAGCGVLLKELQP